jgi:uncharacterized protein (DUF427 family)
MWQFTGQKRPSFAIEPTAGQESVWDYPRPPICADDDREVIVRLQDLQIARTTRAKRVLETASPPTFYIPPDDIDLSCWQRTASSSFCEWKGSATYWSCKLAAHTISSVGWSYEQPTNQFAVIAGYLSFYPALLQCTVDGESVRPQPGGFYGGWVTNEIIGPCKGKPGTGSW